MAWSKLTDMALTDEERDEGFNPTIAAKGPLYPWGLRICLTHQELEKLGLDIADAGVGDEIDMRAFGTVTSISQNDGPDGPCGRVEIQLERLKIENEMTESEEDGE